MTRSAMPPDTGKVGEAILTILASRAPEATVCPSEVARVLAKRSAPTPVHWRDAMPAVHAAVDQLLAEGSVQLSWKGQLMSARTGPYRIRGAVASGPRKSGAP